jgi:hypothetical protein
MIVPSTRITKPFKKLALVILKYFRCKLVHRPIAIHLINHGGALAIIRVNFTHHLLQIILKPRSNLPFAYFSRVEVTKMIDITDIEHPMQEQFDKGSRRVLQTSGGF